MVIDSKGRILGKVSVVDLFVFVVIAFIVVFGIFQVGNDQGIGIFEPMSTITMRLSIDALEDFTADFLQVGDPVSEHNSGVHLGSVTNIDRGDGIQFSRNSDGMLVRSNINHFSAIEITTEFMGHQLENGILVNGHTFLVGEQRVIRVGDTNLFLRISGISIE